LGAGGGASTVCRERRRKKVPNYFLKSREREGKVIRRTFAAPKHAKPGSVIIEGGLGKRG